MKSLDWRVLVPGLNAQIVIDNWIDHEMNTEPFSLKRIKGKGRYLMEGVITLTYTGIIGGFLIEAGKTAYKLMQ